MKIGPTSQRDLLTFEASRIKNETTLPDNKKKENVDTVEISNDSLERLAEQAETVKRVDVEDNLSLKYLRIQNRIENGYYETAEFKELLIEKISGNLFREE